MSADWRKGTEGENGVRLDRYDYSPVKKTLKTASSWTCRKSENRRKLMMVILFCTACLTLGGALLLSTTNVVDDMVLNKLVIKNGTQIYDWWRDPPVETLFRVRIFNYTNSEAYLNGTDKKFHLQEIGPFVYRYKMIKTNVVFDDEGEIVTFQENRSYEFIPEMSPGVSLDDHIIVPNLSLLGAASVMHDTYYIVKMGLATILKGLQVKPFLQLKIQDFLWGYDDTLFSLAKDIVPLQRELPFEQFGLLTSQTGLSWDRISVHTGLKDPNLLGVIAEYNGEDALPYWGAYECNRVDGSEGTIFPKMSKHLKYNINESHSSIPHRLYVFNHQLCRRFPLEQKYSVVSHGFPAVRFQPIDGVLDDAMKKPEHKCFCDPAESVCPPSGLFNATPCAYGTPVMVSFPHFYLGEPSLYESFEGLKPNKEEHEFYLDIHPTLGIPMEGRSRFQLNIMVRRSKGIWQLNGFPDNIILPIAWIEVAVEEIPHHVKSTIRLVTETSQTIQRILMFSLFAVSMTIVLVLVILFLKRYHLNYQKQKPENKIASDDKTADKAFLQSNG